MIAITCGSNGTVLILDVLHAERERESERIDTPQLILKHRHAARRHRIVYTSHCGTVAHSLLAQLLDSAWKTWVKSQKKRI